MMISLLPVITKKTLGTIELSISIFNRLLYLVFGSLIVFLLLSEGTSLAFVIFAAIAIIIATLEEDRWTFDCQNDEIRRRLGFFAFPRKWSVKISDVKAVVLVKDISTMPGFSKDLITKRQQKGISAVILSMNDSRAFVLCSANEKKYDELKKRAIMIVETIKKNLIEV